jgi:hypothetical protein
MQKKSPGKFSHTIYYRAIVSQKQYENGIFMTIKPAA